MWPGRLEHVMQNLLGAAEFVAAPSLRFSHCDHHSVNRFVAALCFVLADWQLAQIVLMQAMQ